MKTVINKKTEQEMRVDKMHDGFLVHSKAAFDSAYKLHIHSRYAFDGKFVELTRAADEACTALHHAIYEHIDTANREQVRRALNEAKGGV